MLKVDASKCTGCRTCELVCSMKHYKAFNPSKAFLKVDISGMSPFPLVCPCSDRPCIKNCPVGALSIKSGIIKVDKKKCTSCGTCVKVCPLKVMRLENGTPRTCDLCGGKPECVKYCTLEVLKVKK